MPRWICAFLSRSLRKPPRPHTMAAFMLTASPATAPVVRVAATGRAPAQRVAAPGVSRRNVSAAAKKSVGDLTEADLKGKARSSLRLPRPCDCGAAEAYRDPWRVPDARLLSSGGV